MILGNGMHQKLNQPIAELGEVGMAFVRGRIINSVRYMQFQHKDQLDKNGDPYWYHPYRVMWRLWDVPGMTEAILHAGLGHDLVEDCEDVDLQVLWQLGYPWLTLDAIDAVTRYENRPDRGETYIDWIVWLARFGSVGAKLVKIADIMDHLAPARQARLPKEFQGLQSKYIRAIEILAPHVPRKCFDAVKFGDYEDGPWQEMILPGPNEELPEDTQLLPVVFPEVEVPQVVAEQQAQEYVIQAPEEEPAPETEGEDSGVQDTPSES